MSEAAAGALTFADIQKSLDELGRVPPPPKMTARPEFVSMLMSKLPRAEHPTTFDAMSGMAIKEDPDLPCRWICHYDGKTTFETLDGAVLNYEHPKLEDLLSIAPLKMHDEPMQVKWYSPTVRYPMIGMGGICHDEPPPKRTRRKRASRGWRKHIRRMKAANRQGVPNG